MTQIFKEKSETKSFLEVHRRCRKMQSLGKLQHFHIWNYSKKFWMKEFYMGDVSKCWRVFEEVLKC